MTQTNPSNTIALGIVKGAAALIGIFLLLGVLLFLVVGVVSMDAVDLIPLLIGALVIAAVGAVALFIAYR
jgi:hypothetical protein